MNPYSNNVENYQNSIEPNLSEDSIELTSKPFPAAIFDEMDRDSGTLYISKNILIFQPTSTRVPPITIDLMYHKETSVFYHPSCQLTKEDINSKNSLGIFYISYQDNYLDPKSIKEIYFSALHEDVISLQKSIQLISTNLRRYQHNQTPLSFSLPTQHSLSSPIISSPLISQPKLLPIQVIGTSLIFQENDIFDIRKNLPFIRQNHNWVRLFSLSSDGTAFSTLYHSTFGSYPLLLAILTDTKERIGSYLPQGLRVQNNYYGTCESFVFKLPLKSSETTQNNSNNSQNINNNDLPQTIDDIIDMDSEMLDENNNFKCWKSSGANHFFISSSHQNISIGGPNCAIWIDPKMQRGFSEQSLTFNSPQLVSSSHFKILDIEVWKIDNSKPL